MSKRPPSDDKRRPGDYPSEPDAKAEPGDHNEPDVDVNPDRMPDTGFELGGTSSQADLRMQIEQLLIRRESASPDAWANLGEEGRALLVELVDDWSIRAHDALFHRLIGVLGELRVKRAVPALSALLKDRSVSDLTKAYAANSLGRIGERGAVDALASSIGVNDEMVRRQVAMALGRIDDDVAVPHLIRLRDDSSAAVSEVAVAAIGRWEEQLGRQIGPKRRVPRARPTTRKKLPAEDE